MSAMGGDIDGGGRREVVMDDTEIELAVKILDCDGELNIPSPYIDVCVSYSIVSKRGSGTRFPMRCVT